MANVIQIIVFPVKDTAKAKDFYDTFLGTKPYIDSPYYIGYKVGDLEVGLDPHATVGPITYTEVQDIKASLEAMTKAGAEIVQDIKDVAEGLLIAQVKDADGNIVGLRQQP